VAQFFGWEWGRYKGKAEAPRFTFGWLLTFGVALVIVLSGVGTLQLVEYAVLSSIIVLPLTYLPVLLVANDAKFMGKHRNGRVINALGWAFFALITVSAIAAFPLFFFTKGGQL
jgi:Mn2+/Fe2+ NRAMP family transporter